MKEKHLISISHLIPHLSLAPRETMLDECRRVVLRAVATDVIPISSRLIESLLDHIDRISATNTPTEFQSAVTNFAMWLEDHPWSPKPDEPVYKDAWTLVEHLSFFERWKMSLNPFVIDVYPSDSGEGREAYEMKETLIRLYQIMRDKVPAMKVSLNVGVFQGQVMWMTDTTISVGTVERGFIVAQIDEVRNAKTSGARNRAEEVRADA